MHIQVRLLNGFKKKLLYSVSDAASSSLVVGSIVCVPLRAALVYAVVDEILLKAPRVAFPVRQMDHLEQFPADKHYTVYLKQLAQYYRCDPLFFIKRTHQFIGQDQQDVALHDVASAPQAVLTAEQEYVVQEMLPSIKNPVYFPALLHGVTGAGKTEVYKKLIVAAFEQGKTTVLLLPEVTLALQFERLLEVALGGLMPVMSFHSATPAARKRLLWQYLVEGKPMLLLGVHLPVLLPIANLGLIVVDEEHDVGYQEKKFPKINTKEAALLRAQQAGIPIVLGSATPSVQSLYNVEKRNWRLFTLTQRFGGAFPTMQVVQLKRGRRASFWISDELEQALSSNLAKKEQSILFLNRRGFSFFMQCSGCGFIPTCTACAISLTHHEDESLRCHYCGFKQQIPHSCPTCSAGQHLFLKKGLGTQQVMSIVQKLFPDAVVARADLDVTANKKKWQKTMEDFQAGRIDILVGTQTITKGYHFPKVTVVGVVWGDINLNFPMYNAAETTLQQLLQVAGRAGRQAKESRVIVQMMAPHAITQYLDEKKYMQFYQQEIVQRQEIGYPPYNRLVELELSNADEAVLLHDARQVAQLLRSLASDDVTVLGPACPPVSKIKHTYRQKIYIKAPTMQEIIVLFKALDTLALKSALYFTPNPLSM